MPSSYSSDRLRTEQAPERPTSRVGRQGARARTQAESASPWTSVIRPALAGGSGAGYCVRRPGLGTPAASPRRLCQAPAGARTTERRRSTELKGCRSSRRRCAAAGEVSSPRHKPPACGRTLRGLHRWFPAEHLLRPRVVLGHRRIPGGALHQRGQLALIAQHANQRGPRRAHVVVLRKRSGHDFGLVGQLNGLPTSLIGPHKEVAHSRVLGPGPVLGHVAEKLIGYGSLDGINESGIRSP